MPETKETVIINANIEISSQALQTIVAVAKQLSGPNEKGHYQIDTAGLVSEMISKFLAQKDFERFVAQVENYPR